MIIEMLLLLLLMMIVIIMIISITTITTTRMIISSLRAKCLHHAHSRGQCAAVCKSLYNTSSAYHVQHVTCQGDGRDIAVSR